MHGQSSPISRSLSAPRPRSVRTASASASGSSGVKGNPRPPTHEVGRVPLDAAEDRLPGEQVGLDLRRDGNLEQWVGFQMDEQSSAFESTAPISDMRPAGQELYVWKIAGRLLQPIDLDSPADERE